ncbi:hypothetical protein JVT61DRAFT_40 [Boletus reticuloceps]|uniref:Uncharacterized protein n=1 Tax=Boletus reticuloceps TaxID=495285 RepID=A0A8I2Z2F4_9AGAM|nr:hypothetical protein JVT61DRAFT_40 [Boletus reticuloceps]
MEVTKFWPAGHITPNGRIQMEQCRNPQHDCSRAWMDASKDDSPDTRMPNFCGYCPQVQPQQLWKLVILPEEDVRGTGTAATWEHSQRNALCTWEELNARTSSPEQRWVSQDYVNCLWQCLENGGFS